MNTSPFLKPPPNSSLKNSNADNRDNRKSSTNFKTFDFSYTPIRFHRSKTQFTTPNLSKSINYIFKPTRHSSLNYEKREKYISHSKSFLLKKVMRINKMEDHNLQLISRDLASSNLVYEGEEFSALNSEISPTSGFFQIKKSTLKSNKSPLFLRLTRIESQSFHEEDPMILDEPKNKDISCESHNNIYEFNESEKEEIKEDFDLSKLNEPNDIVFYFYNKILIYL